MRLLLVLVGGGLGAAARYLVSTWMAGRLGTAFPWGTLTVNVVGAFLIGVLGGFKTFSSFSLETWRLLEQDELVRAGLNALGSLAPTR